MVGSMMDEDQMANMLSNPNVAQQMNEMMNNDAFLDMMIQQNPMLRNNPNARDILRSPMFRQMMTNPEALRSAARMQRMMRGQMGGQGSFPAPGVTDNTPASDAQAQGNSDANAAGQPPINPFDPAGWANIPMPGAQAGGAAANPFAGLMNPMAMGMGAPPSAAQPGGATGAPTDAAGTDATRSAGEGGAPGATPNPPANPFAALFGAPGAGAGAATNPLGLPPMSPEALQQMMQMMGMSSPSASPVPPDNRPPEERYADQLRQLNDMGFYDFDRNIAALRRSGGSVQGAVEHLLSS